MPTTFERAKLVIDALNPVAKELVHDGDVDAMVRTRLRSLSQAYDGRLLKSGRAPVDYTKTTTHIAYTYRSLSAHADWMFKALCLARKAATKILAKPKVLVASVGGGPGSDAAGILKFCEREAVGKGRLNFVILDRESAWNRCRSELFATFEGEFDIRQKYQKLDLTADGEWTGDWEFLKADIFTFSFSLSEVWSFNGDGSVSRFLDRVVTEAKSDALFCYLDNGGSSFLPLVEAEFDERADLVRLGAQDDERMLLSGDEQCSVLEAEYREKFAQRPKLTGNVSLRVWKKK